MERINQYMDNREKEVNQLIHFLQNMLKQERETINCIMGLAEQNIRMTVNKMIEKEKGLMNETMNRLRDKVEGQDLTDDKLTIKKINDVINSNMINPIEQAKQTEYLEEDFKLINEIQKEMNALSSRLEKKSERMNIEMKEMQKRQEEYEAQEMKKMEQIVKDQRVIQEIQPRNRLWQCKNEIWINSNKTNEEFKAIIEQYESESKEYRIEIDFRWCSQLDWKIKAMEMIESVGVEHKVGEIWVRLNNYNPFSSELFEAVNKRFKNLYDIKMVDYLDNIDKETHDGFKRIAREKRLFRFELAFNRGELFSSEEGIQLLKEYNDIMKKQ